VIKAKEEDIIIVGAGGHAKVCIEILRSMGEKVSFCISNTSSASECLSIPVLYGDYNLSQLYSQGYYRAFIGIGDNALRLKLAEQAIQYGYTLVNAISPNAVISKTAQIGSGVAIMPGSVVNTDTIISDLSIINTSASVDHDCYIGKAVHISPHCALAGNVIVGNYSFLGIGSKVIPKVKIGQGVITGAGSVVISDIEPNITVVGVPARIIS
jgi:UDP-perosamine 4-acetyltransferase